jgi:hypothetical protein
MLFKGSNNLVQIYRSFAITGNYGRRSFSKYGKIFHENHFSVFLAVLDEFLLTSVHVWEKKIRFKKSDKILDTVALI